MWLAGDAIEYLIEKCILIVFATAQLPFCTLLWTDATRQQLRKFSICICLGPIPYQIMQIPNIVERYYSWMPQLRSRIVYLLICVHKRSSRWISLYDRRYCDRDTSCYAVQRPRLGILKLVFWCFNNSDTSFVAMPLFLACYRFISHHRKILIKINFSKEKPSVSRLFITH